MDINLVERFAFQKYMSSPQAFSGSFCSIFNLHFSAFSIIVGSYSFWPLHCLYFFDLRLLILPLWIFNIFALKQQEFYIKYRYEYSVLLWIICSINCHFFTVCVLPTIIKLLCLISILVIVALYQSYQAKCVILSLYFHLTVALWI